MMMMMRQKKKKGQEREQGVGKGLKNGKYQGKKNSISTNREEI